MTIRGLKHIHWVVDSLLSLFENYNWFNYLGKKKGVTKSRNSVTITVITV